jgi:hypothetical protein
VSIEGSDGAHADSRSQVRYDHPAPAQAALLAEIAVRECSTYLAEILPAELNDRSVRRRACAPPKPASPRIKQLTESHQDFRGFIM